MDLEKNKIFIATFFEDDTQNLCKLLEKVATQNIHLRIVPIEKIHITWKFIGDIPINENEKIFNAIKGHSSIIKNGILKFDKLEIWPNLRNPKLLVLTPSKYSRKFVEYFNEIEENLYINLNINKDIREFKPHITIARFKQKKDAKRLKNIDCQTIKLEINKINVVKSSNSANGVSYETLFIDNT